MPQEEVVKEVKRQLEITHGPMSTWSFDLRNEFAKLRVQLQRSNADINRLLKPFGIELSL